MGWPPEKYQKALEMAEQGLQRALTYSERQAEARFDVNTVEDRMELTLLLKRVKDLQHQEKVRDVDP